ncbi:MAG: hypothetical protein ACD_56C00151G0001 [uncultured bacterium]|nr:MAG: hypothetical protein ACD_56C00151G0001 [uncultured bacterium]
MGYGFGFGGIFMILFWGLVIWAIVSLVQGNLGRGCHTGNCHKKNRGGALETLRQRYAKGEISKQEFEQMKKDLQ